MVFCYTSVATIGTSYIMRQATNQGKELVQDFPDDADYFDVDSDGASMIQKMLESQGTDVDTVSGATYSSEGIIDAVNAALFEATS